MTSDDQPCIGASSRSESARAAILVRVQTWSSTSRFERTLGVKTDVERFDHKG